MTKDILNFKIAELLLEYERTNNGEPLGVYIEYTQEFPFQTYEWDGEEMIALDSDVDVKLVPKINVDGNFVESSEEDNEG